MPLSHAETSEGPGTRVQEVLPVLLHGADPLFMTAKDRLACFGVSKGIADLVIRHSKHTKLQLSLGGAASATGTSSSSTIITTSSSSTTTTSSAQQLAAQSSNVGGAASAAGSSSSASSFQAAQQLAAQSSNVTLALHGGLITPAACLWQSITSLHLHGMELTPNALSSHGELQLHRLPHLHTLSLEACRVGVETQQLGLMASQQQGPLTASQQPGSAAASQQQSPLTASQQQGSAAASQQQGPATASQQQGLAASSPAASSIRTLKCAHCRTSTASILRTLSLSLLDPAQLQTLITTDSGSLPDLLAQLPALQELQLLPVARDRYAPEVNDATFQLLLSHPRLTRVSLLELNLRKDYADHPCSWATLKLTHRHLLMHTLAKLPLANIQLCTVVAGIQDMQEGDPDRQTCPADMLFKNVSRCPRLVFEPAVGRTDWRPKEPTFTLAMYHATNAQAVQLIKMVTARWGGGGALIIHLGGPRALTAAMLAESLADAPHTLTTVALPFGRPDDWTGLGHSDYKGALANLPEHITHVVLFEIWANLSRELWRRGLAWHVTGVTRPLKIKMYNYQFYYDFPMGVDLGLREWLSTHASNQVEVEFQSAELMQ